MKKLVIVGCGRLGGIVAEAVIKGILPEYDLVGVYSRTVSKAESMAARMQEQGKPCLACTTIADLLALKPDYLVDLIKIRCFVFPSRILYNPSCASVVFIPNNPPKRYVSF